MKLKYLLPLLLLISSGLHAEGVWFTGKIRSVYPLADGKVVLTFMTESPACNNSNTPKYYYLSVGVNGVNDAGLKNMYGLVLTAAAIGKEVSINFDASASGCDINRLFVAF